MLALIDNACVRKNLIYLASGARVARRIGVGGRKALRLKLHIVQPEGEGRRVAVRYVAVAIEDIRR